MFGGPRRGDRELTCRDKCPQQSTAFVGSSQSSRNLGEIIGVPYFASTDERVSCICQQAIGRIACLNSSLSEPPMWSRVAAANMAICGYFRAMWSCRAAGASISRTISVGHLPGRHRPGLAAAAVPTRPKMAAKALPTARKKLWPRPEPPASAAVNGEMPGEAPQPLTLNHPASNPGRICGRGSSFLRELRLWGTSAASLNRRRRTWDFSARRLFSGNDQIVAVNHRSSAGKAEDRIDIGG